MNSIIMPNSKNPLIYTGILITPKDLKTVRISSTIKIQRAMNNNSQGFAKNILFAVLSSLVLNNLMKSHITIATNPRLYHGATCPSAIVSSLNHNTPC